MWSPAIPRFPGRLKASRLPDAVGGRVPGVLKSAGDEETGNFLTVILNVHIRRSNLKNPKTNGRMRASRNEERAKFTELLEAGFVDTFRYFYPDQEGIYSWWSYRFSARAKNAGWRIDYFCVSESLKDRLVDAKIHTEVMGSDHCPVELDIQ